MQKYYLDTSILLDAYENRNEVILQKLILKLIEEKCIILLSDLHIKELKSLGYDFDEINSIFRIFKIFDIKRIHITKTQIEESNQLALQIDIPKKDILHAIIAKDNEAILIAADRHFEKLNKIIGVKKPHELL